MCPHFLGLIYRVSSHCHHFLPVGSIYPPLPLSAYHRTRSLPTPFSPLMFFVPPWCVGAFLQISPLFLRDVTPRVGRGRHSNVQTALPTPLCPPLIPPAHRLHQFCASCVFLERFISLPFALTHLLGCPLIWRVYFSSPLIEAYIRTPWNTFEVTSFATLN